MDKIKIGILGAGNIASTFAKTVSKMDCAEIYAIGSRSYEKAFQFASENKIKKAYGSYEEMLKDENISLVYIATPHSHHYDNIKMCIKYDKHVLCEKAFTVNSLQAKEVFDMAKKKNLLLTEAIWTRYMPMTFKIKEIIKSGEIGTIKSLTANLGYSIGHLDRLTNMNLAGGALLDLGVYTIHFAFSFINSKIEKITSSACFSSTGSDTQNVIILNFENGVIASLHSSVLCNTNKQGIIYGDKGYMVIDNINNFEKIKVYDLDHNKKAVFERPKQITGYEYQVISCVEAIKSNKIECFEIPHKETVRVMKTMDDTRSQWGMSYPCE